MGTIALSPGTLLRVERLFPEAQRQEAIRILVEECGSNLPLLAEGDDLLCERIRFAVLRLSRGTLLGLQRSVEDAKIDWRDVLVAAGFARDIHAHLAWLPDQT